MKTKVWIALLAVYIVWGSTYLAIRFAVETIPPFMSAGMRFLISGIILLIWRRMAGDAMPTPHQWRSAAIAGSLLLLGGNSILSFAEQRIPSGIAALLVGTAPLWLVLLEALRPGGVKPSLASIIGLIVGFGGIFLLIGPAEILNGAPQFDMLGIGAVTLAAFLWSLGSIYSRSADLPKSSLMSTGAEMFIASLAILAVSGLRGEWIDFQLSAVATKSWLGMAYLITFGSLIGFVAYGWLLKNAPVSLTATYAYVNPLVAVFMGAWLADEVLNTRILVAALIIISSVVLINRKKPQKVELARKEAEPSPAD